MPYCNSALPPSPPLRSNQEAIDVASRHTDAEMAARALAAEAYKRGSMDNISCVVALFRLGGGPQGIS